MHGDFFQGQTDTGLFYRPNHSGETRLYKQEDKQDDLLLLLGDKKAALMGNEYQMPEGVDKNFFHLI